MGADLEPDRGNVHRAGMEAAWRNGQPDLRGRETHGHRRVHRSAGNLPRRRIDAGGNVDRDDPCARRVDPLDHARNVFSGRLVQADPEQRVDDHVRLADLAELLDDRHLSPRLLQDACANTAVAAVSPAAADDGHLSGEPLEDDLGDGRSGALHQLVQRAVVRLFGAPRLVGREERLQPHPSTTTATAAASSREWVIESSILPAPTFFANCAVRPLKYTPGFGRPRISISFHVK